MKNELDLSIQKLLREYPVFLEKGNSHGWSEPETLLEELWKWQKNVNDRDTFLQIRDCFCKAAEVLDDRDGTIVFRAAELMKASGELDQSTKLYEQILPRALRYGTHSISAMIRGYYWAGAVRGFRALRSSEPADDTMRDALWLLGQALNLRADYKGSEAPDNVTILWAIANCYVYLNEQKHTQQCCQNILELQKTLPDAHSDRVETCIQFSQFCREYGKREECQQWLLKAAALLEQTAPSEEMSWMYGLVACNCRKLPYEKRLWLYHQEKKYSSRLFLINPREASQWHKQVSRICANLGDMDGARYHSDEAFRIDSENLHT